MSISDRRESEFDPCIDGSTLPFHELDDSAFNAHNGVNKAVPLRKPKMRGSSCILSPYESLRFYMNSNRKLYCWLYSRSAQNSGQEVSAAVEESRGNIHPSDGVAHSGITSVLVCSFLPLIDFLDTDIRDTSSDRLVSHHTHHAGAKSTSSQQKRICNMGKQFQSTP